VKKGGISGEGQSNFRNQAPGSSKCFPNLPAEEGYRKKKNQKRKSLAEKRTGKQGGGEKKKATPKWERGNNAKKI